MSEATRVLSETEAALPRPADELLPLIYDELRQLAARQLTREKPGQTLDATALVHEAYVRLVQPQASQQWNGQGHFFAAAAEAMRRILIERARHKASHRAGGRWQRRALPDLASAATASAVDLLSLNEALERLERQDPRRAALVKLRFFAGLTIEQAAQALGISTSTADNDWAYARCWLRLAIEGQSA